MKATKEHLEARLRSIAATALQAIDFTGDLETLGAHLDDLEQDLKEAMHLANTLE